MPGAMRVLFITANRVGDAVLSSGLLEHVRQTHPAARFTIVCGPAAAGLFARLPNREATIVLEKRPRQMHWVPLWARLVRQRWDWVIDLRGSAMAWLVPAGRRSVLRSRRGQVLPKTAQLGALLRLDPAPLPVVWTAPEDDALAARWLPPGRPILALGPTANWTGKIWPPERFVALFQALAAGPLPGAVAAVFSGPGAAEAALAAPVLAALPGAIDLSGRLTLPEAAACLRRARLFVGNDSGLMHLAAAAGAPTLGLFGPTPRAIYAPAGPLAVAVGSRDGTMPALPVADVLDAALELLRREAKPGRIDARYRPMSEITEHPWHLQIPDVPPAPPEVPPMPPGRSPDSPIPVEEPPPPLPVPPDPPPAPIIA
jgi:ADP-heptose:LPS heptosyltransferase